MALCLPKTLEETTKLLREAWTSSIAHFERRLIAEQTKNGIAVARAKGKKPSRQPLDADGIATALKLVEAGLSPTAAAHQLGLERSTIYQEIKRAGVQHSY